MKKKILCILAVAVLLLPVFGRAADDSELKAKFFFGYRLVDTSGSENKYKEDINLASGPRLFNFQLSYAPTGDMKKLVDEITVNLYNFGGDPFESFNLSMVKYGKYTLTYQRQKAAYFYAEEQWTEPLTFWQMRESTGGDFHTFDFDRVIDRAAAKIWLGQNAHLYFNFDRFSKKGFSTTTLDIFQEEFEYDKPVDQSSKTVTLGLDYSLPKLTLAVEEKFSTFKDANSLFLPGFSEGEWFNYPSPNTSNLFYFFQDMPYDTQTNSTTARIVAKPVKNLILKGAVNYMLLKMNNLDYMESAYGTDRNKVAQKYENEITSFDLSRKITNIDFDLSYLFSDKLALVAAFRSNAFDQQGMMDYESMKILPPASTVVTKSESKYKFDTIGFDGGLQFQPMDKITLTVGLRSETRTITAEAGEPDEKTKRLGFFGNLNWQLFPSLKIGADYQFGDYKDQIIAVTPAKSNRLRLTARFKKGEWYANGSFLTTKITNDDDLDLSVKPQKNGWNSTTTNLNLRLGYMGKKMTASAGWAMINNKNTANNRSLFATVPSGFPKTWPIYYSGKVNLMDLSLSSKLNAKWSLGAMVGYYTAPAYYGGYYVYQATNEFASTFQPKYTEDKNYKNRDLSRLTFKPYIEYVIDGNFLVQLSYWLVDFKDPFKINYTNSTVGFDNNYKANILELSFGYKL